MLCQTCQNIFRGSCWHQKPNHHFYIHQLERAAFERCHICQVIWRGISDRLLTIAKEAFEAPPEQGALIRKPILTYYLESRSLLSRVNNNYISQLSFVVENDRVVGSPQAFTFFLKPMRSMTMPLPSIPWY